MAKAIKKQALGRGLSALLKDTSDDIMSAKDKNADKIKSATESLQKASHKLAEEAYKATAAQQGQQQPGADQGGAQGEQPASDQGNAQDKKDDVIDADFKASSDK